MCKFSTSFPTKKIYTWVVSTLLVKNKKANITKPLIVLLLALLFSCTSPRHSARSSTAASIIPINGKLWSSVYQQKAAEYAALCYQAYNAARMSLDRSLEAASPGKPPAIITDIDETFLDNSPYAVQQALHGEDYDSKTWQQWTVKGAALPLPGSVDFFNYAASKGVTVFYITNRNEQERAGTMANLKKYNYPFADQEHLVMMQDESSKEKRRQSVATRYSILLLLGDNLADFSSLWDKKTTKERLQQVTDTAAAFGTRFILLPNLTYGGWEDALYGNRHSLSPAQKDSAIRANLTGY
ncbi:5'-nucleotidase, lipoprotein e(P4) family [Niabella sp. CC-SYL272]|uniref:5'-nucleotidase, lipoprotein e(P4) family n=1 Tax=Niabella agricola TaxID=2891571 RepID=UPI001F2DDA6D|nr:5'-nucleotidase, lipoprotein e(P4) family [Niabella agricola]MCF3109336.1 5'-nucleotidase, lipoprotein e(P4) family [Niabella agricola]